MSSKTDKSAHEAKHDSSSKAESHRKEQNLTGRALDEHIALRAAGASPEPELNQGQVHPEAGHASGHEGHASVARIHMDQIDAVATPQGVVLFALTESGDIWQLTTFSGQPEWHQILTPEVPAEDV